MAIVSLRQKRLRAQEIREFLLSLPVAEHSPMIQYELLVAELSTLQKLLRKLKAFIQFLGKLNPKQYLEWMHQAFASVSVINPKSEDLDCDFEEQRPSPNQPQIVLNDSTQTHKKKIKK